MTERAFWQQRLQAAWERAPIAWLSGVRRSGKTTLARSLGDDRTLFLNCDEPAVEDLVRDPVLFLRSVAHPIVVLDEVHQLRDPARLLKISADRFPELRVLATGSSTLAATRRFRDTLAGRKRQVHLVPVLTSELAAFGATLERRLLHGGLPQALLAAHKDPGFYREWIDSFFARDIQRLFGFRDINRFTAFVEHILKQSGGLFETTAAARAVGITRPTVESHLRALDITHAATIVRPFHGGGQAELVKMPKVYAFDTGFVCYARGWDPLRDEDRGLLWEHLVLEHLQATLDEPVRYWRDKGGREIDFVLAPRRDEVHAIECKWHPDAFDAAALRVFRQAYPNGTNYVVTPSGDPPRTRRYGNLTVRICMPEGLPATWPEVRSEK